MTNVIFTHMVKYFKHFELLVNENASDEKYKYIKDK